MLKFYFNGSPNPTKVALFLEEAGIAYEPIPIDTRTGDQFQADFLSVNPNGKVPAIVDGDVVVFDSNAILLYLAEKTGKFLPPSDPANRGRLLSWLMFVATGVGPYSAARRCISSTSRRRRSLTPTTAISSRRGGISAFSTRISPVAATCSAIPTRSSTWMSGAGRAWFPSSSATTPGRNSRTSSGWSRRNRRPTRRGAGGRTEGQVHLQGGMDDEARGVMFKHLARTAA